MEEEPRDEDRLTEKVKMNSRISPPHKYPTSTPQAQDKLHAPNLNIIKLIQVVGEKEHSVKDIMEGFELKDRKNVLNLYLNPAIAEGYVRLLYPDKPRHPRQKYLLTAKGLALFYELTKDQETCHTSTNMP